MCRLETYFIKQTNQWIVSAHKNSSTQKTNQDQFDAHFSLFF